MFILASSFAAQYPSVDPYARPWPYWIKDGLRPKVSHLHSGKVDVFIYTCVQASNCAPPTQNFRGLAWGDDDYLYVRHAASITMYWNGSPINVPYSCYADLGTVRKEWIERRGAHWVLVLIGGLPGDGYECWLTFDRSHVRSRFVTYTEPSLQDTYEKWTYHSPPTQSLKAHGVSGGAASASSPSVLTAQPLSFWIKGGFHQKIIHLQDGKFELFLLTSALESSKGSTASKFWGGFTSSGSNIYAAHVISLTMYYDWTNLYLPSSCYMDLGTVRKVWIEHKKHMRWVVFIEGGLPGEEYECRITMNDEGILSRSIDYTTPSKRGQSQETIYRWPLTPWDTFTS